MMRRAILAMVVLASIACLCFFLFARAKSTHKLTLYAHYQHAQNVQKGTLVSVDGVQLGSVASVTVRPEFGDRPVEVVLMLNPPYELKIPAGSIAQISLRGILGPTVVDIDTRTATGLDLATGSSIEGRESTDDQAAHALGVIMKALVDQSNHPEQQHAPVLDKRRKVDHGH